MEEELPFSREAENVILGNIIEYDGVYEDVASYLLNGKVFYQKEAKLLLERIKQLKKDAQEMLNYP